MRAIHLSNERHRDAQIAFGVEVERNNSRYVLPDGEEKINVKFLKSTVETSEEALFKEITDPHRLAELLIDSDPDVNMETTGRKLRRTHKLYVDQDNRIIYRINLFQIIYNPDGTEKERRDVNRVPGNVNSDIPLQWTGRKFPKEEAIRKFVFTRKYQIRHVNGVTFDFLYNMAKELDSSDSMVLVGAGPKGNAPILLSRGGEPYRGFLEGRVDGDRYCLILHLSDMELKGFNV